MREVQLIKMFMYIKEYFPGGFVKTCMRCVIRCSGQDSISLRNHTNVVEAPVSVFFLSDV